MGDQRDHASASDSATQAFGGEESGHEQRFWMGFLYTALASFVASTLAVLLYVVRTPEQPNRLWLYAIAAGAVCFVTWVYRHRERVVHSRYRLVLFGGKNFVSAVFIAVAALLDGGATSPITNLFVLPILFLAIGYPLGVVLACGLATLLTYLGVVWLTAGWALWPLTTIEFLTLVVGLALASLGAIIRGRKDRELAQLRQRLASVAVTDELTGCQNQRAYEMVLNEEIARSARYQRPLALLVLDIDNFKAINDEHGHQLGDEVLRQLGIALRSTARDSDQVARAGGDEFALLAPETNKRGALTLARRLQSQFRSQELPVPATLSIGVHSDIPQARGVVAFLQRADRAMYTAKRLGRDRIILWQSEPAVTES